MVAESWLGSVSLGTVPVVTGTWTIAEDESKLVPGTLTFDVPLKPELLPLRPDHPLANYGQQLRIKIGVRMAGGGTEWVSMGRWLIADAVPLEETIQVTADSLEKIVEWDRLLAPVRITGPTRGDGLRTLLDSALPVLVLTSSNPAMGPLPVDQDRLQGVHDLIDAWPARSHTDDQGTLVIEDPWPDDLGTPVWSTEGRTLGTEPDTSTAPVYNGYRVETVPEDGTTVPVSEVWFMSSGPMAWGSAFWRRPGFFSSPTLPAVRDTLRAVAQSLTLRSVRRARALRVRTLPDPRIVRGDVVHVVDHKRDVDMVGRVISTVLTRTQLELLVAEGL